MKNESYKQFLPVCIYVKFPVSLMSLWNHSPLATYGYQLWKQPSLNNNNNGEGNENVLYKKKGNSPLVHPIIRPACPPKFCINFVFHFFWVLKPSQEKLKTMLMQNLGGQIRCILGDVHVTNRLRLATQQLCTYTTLFCKFLCRFCTTTT